MTDRNMLKLVRRRHDRDWWVAQPCDQADLFDEYEMPIPEWCVVRSTDIPPSRPVEFLPAIPEKNRWLSHEEWLVERTRYAMLLLRNCTETNPKKRGGVPVLAGTRFTIAQVLAELAEGKSVAELADDFDLDAEQLKQFLEGLAICFDRPVFK